MNTAAVTYEFIFTLCCSVRNVILQHQAVIMTERQDVESGAETEFIIFKLDQILEFACALRKKRYCIWNELKQISE